MANRPRVSSVTVKVPGIDPELEETGQEVTVCITLEEGSPPITADEYFLIVMLNSDNEIYKYPGGLNKNALHNGKKTSEGGGGDVYEFTSDHPFDNTSEYTFHKLKFSKTPDVITSWSNLEKLVPKIDLNIDDTL